MIDVFSKMFDKLSSYQLFNYLLPGIIFHYGIEQITSFHLVPKDSLYRLFIYYITGMILSRIGSTIIEPLYKKLCIVVYAGYKEYLDAAKGDPKLDILVMENNTYRTLVTTFILMLIIYLLDQIEWLRDKYNSVLVVSLSLLLLIGIMTLSFRKQTAFVRSRTHFDLGKKDCEQIDNLKAQQKKIKLLKLIFKQ